MPLLHNLTLLMRGEGAFILEKDFCFLECWPETGKPHAVHHESGKFPHPRNEWRMLRKQNA